jgi:hypothetical protein
MVVKMAVKKLIENHWYKFNDRGEIHVGYYLGRQKGFECCVCGCGHNAFTFNIWHNTYDYETWGYGKEHLPIILEDLGEKRGIIIDK